MKKTNFLEQLESTTQAARDFIQTNLKKGNKVIFLSEKERDEDEDKLYELPFGSKITKHGFYDEFSIVSVENKNGDFIFEGICKGEGDNDNLDWEDISDAALCFLADLLSKKL